MLSQDDQSGTVFVGRQKELGQLHEMFSRVCRRRSRTIAFVRGDYGVGKTALVRHFLDTIGDQGQEASPLIGSGQFTAENQSAAYTAFAQAHMELLHQSGGLRQIKGQLGSFVLRIAPAWISIIPVVGGLAGAVATTAVEIRDFARPQQHYSLDEVRNQYVNSLVEIAEKSTVVLFLDDLQWADESSLALLSVLGSSNRLDNRPVMIIASYRPVEALETGVLADSFRETHANLMLRANVAEITLDDNPDDYGIKVVEFMSKRYPKNDFPKRLAPLIQEHTHGHALFITQLLSWWEDQGIIAAEGETGEQIWRLTRKIDLDTPPSIKLAEVIDFRIRRLSEQLKDIVKCAAVIGESFDLQTISGVLDLSARTLSEASTALEKQYRLILPETMLETDLMVFDSYRFIHRFIRDRIYEQLGQSERRLLHQLVGESLELLLQPNTDIVAGQLARHFSEAGLRRKAIQYALNAAQYEHSRSNWLQARHWSSQGLNWLNKLPESPEMSALRLNLLETLAGSHRRAGNLPDAEQYYDQALTLARRMNAPPDRLAKLYGFLSYTSSNSLRAMALAQEGMRLINERSLPKDATYLQFMVFFGSACWCVDDAETALHTYELVLSHADLLDKSPKESRILAEVHRRLGDLHEYQDRYSLALEHYRQSVEIARQIGHQSHTARGLINMADVFLLKGSYTEAEEAIVEGLRIAVNNGSRSIEADALYSLGILRFWQKRYPASVSYLKQSISLALDLGYVWILSNFYADLAETYLAMGNSAMAQTCLAEALTAAKDVEADLAYAAVVMGRFKSTQGEWAEADRAFSQALRHFEETSPSPWVQARIKLHYGEMHAQKGDYEQARRLLTESREIFQRLALEHKVSEVTMILDSLSD